MEDLNATYEYVVSTKKIPKYRLRRFLMIAGYVLYVLVLFTAGVLSKLLVPMLALVPLTTWILVWFTWRYAAVEFEYSLTAGVMTFSYIYGGRSRKKVCEIRIKEMTAIAPFDGAYIKEAEKYAPEDTVDFTSDIQSPDCYYALYETKKKRRGIVYFEATAQALRIMRHYNSAATVVREVRY